METDLVSEIENATPTQGGVGLASAAICSALWSQDDPTENGIYLRKFDRHDDDDEAETYHVRDGKTYTTDGEEMVCLGGIWKRICDLPEAESGDATSPSALFWQALAGKSFCCGAYWMPERRECPICGAPM